jgi:glycosyltransferase involved in cell wall biosynthesis
MITIFTPSFADESDTNAQNLTVKEIVSRLDPGTFRVRMFCEGLADPRISGRPNTRLLPWRGRGNTLRTLWQCLADAPDVYFYPREGPLDAAFFQLRRWLRMRTAVVTHVVSGGLDRELPRPTLARNIREADAVFGNCAFVSSLVCDRLGVNIGTIHNGIDRRFFYPNDSGSGERRLTVLFAGSFRPYKRVDIVIRQATRWPRVDFRIAGRGEEEQRCRSLVLELGCANVSFLGHLTLQHLGEEMRRADLFFFPSILEGHPQVLGQAAASGLPVVAMNAYRPDYVVHGKTGLLADSDDDLQGKLDLLLASPDIRRSMAEAAIAHACRFDWGEVAQRWQAVFEKVVAARGKN